MQIIRIGYNKRAATPENRTSGLASPATQQDRQCKSTKTPLLSVLHRRFCFMYRYRQNIDWSSTQDCGTFTLLNIRILNAMHIGDQEISQWGFGTTFTSKINLSEALPSNIAMRGTDNESVTGLMLS